MKARRVLVLVMAAVFAVPSGCSLFARHGEHGEEAEQAVSLTDLPPAAQVTILNEAAGHEIAEVEEVTRGGVVTYEAEWIVGDEEVEVTVAADGKLLGKETEPADDDEDDEDDD